MEGTLDKLAEEIVDAFIDSFDNGNAFNDVWDYTEEEYRKEYIEEWTAAVKEVLPSSVFVLHGFFAGWTKHQTLGVYYGKDSAYTKLLNVLEEHGSAIENCEEVNNPEIEIAFHDMENELSVWITEHEIL
jgi:hypothetical protein